MLSIPLLLIEVWSCVHAGECLHTVKGNSGMALLSPHLPRPAHPACDTDSWLCPPAKVSEYALHLERPAVNTVASHGMPLFAFFWTNNIRHKQGFVSWTPLWSFYSFSLPASGRSALWTCTVGTGESLFRV